MSIRNTLKGFLTLACFRDLLIVSTLIVVVGKILLSDFSIDLSGFSFTDLLALIMALFSVWLSAMFYFKSSDDSKAFYDNTYKFTKETSEMLGRIEAGFGEKLTSLNENYIGLSGKFDRLPAHLNDQNKVSEKEDIARQKEIELTQLVKDFVAKSQLPSEITNEFEGKIENTMQELKSVQGEIAELKNNKQASLSPDEILTQMALTLAFDIQNSNTPLQDRCLAVLPKFSKQYISQLKEYGFLTNENKFTFGALLKLRSIMEKIRTNP